MKKFLFLGMIMTILKRYVKPCRVSRDFIFPTIEESYYLCGAVIEGTVKHVENADVLNGSSIILKDIKFYKGCHPKDLKEVKITGYSSGSRCGVYPPRSGKKVIVFVCKDPNVPNGWILHRFAPYAGQFRSNRRHKNELINISGGLSKCMFGDKSEYTCLSRT